MASMHAFVLSSLPIDFTTDPDTLVLVPEKSLGVEEVRSIQAFLSRKPSQKSANRIFVLEAHLLTITAQNALLKTLEEPPGASVIYLITRSPDLLLPTVLSRVQLVDSTEKASATDTAQVEKVIGTLGKATPGERAALVDSLNFTRESALAFVDALEQWLHIHITDNSQKIDYEKIVQARKFLKANVNVKLTLDALFFSL